MRRGLTTSTFDYIGVRIAQLKEDREKANSYKVTDTIDGKEVVARESFDVRFENSKIKEIIVASRQVLPE